MSVYNNVGDTIEGMSVDCDGKAIYPQGIKKHPITKKTMRFYTTDRTSHAVIKEAGIQPKDEGIRKATQHFHRDVDDKVTGDALSRYTDLKAAAKIETIHGKGASHRHGTQFASFKKLTIATVKVPLQNLLKKLGYSSKCITQNKDAD